MIFWPCCCDANCRCVGCAILEISGVTSGSYLCDEVVGEAYNRTIVMWDQGNSTSTPFDLLSDPTDCGVEVTNYPGTKCKGESYVCCQANYSDTPIEPIPLGDTGYEVPTTEPGTDCFPALVCTFGYEGENRVDVAVCTTKGQRPDAPTVHYYVDANGYVWVAIVAYELDTATDIVIPHWVTIFKSTAAINCSTINTNYMEGQEFSFTEVCSGVAQGATDCAETTTPITDLSAVVLTLTIYNSATRCCELVPIEPCNDDDGLCDPDVPCNCCLNGISSFSYLLEVETGWTDDTECCSRIDGSYVVESISVENTSSSCFWEGCYPIEQCTVTDSSSFPYAVLGLVASFWITCSNTNTPILNFSIILKLNDDCSDSLYEPGAWIAGVLPLSSTPNCLDFNRLEIPVTYANPDCGGDINTFRAYITAI